MAGGIPHPSIRSCVRSAAAASDARHNINQWKAGQTAATRAKILQDFIVGARGRGGPGYNRVPLAREGEASI